MSRECYISGKSKLKGNKVSHSQRKKIKHSRPNLRKVKVIENSAVKSIKVSMKSLNLLKKDKIKNIKLVKNIKDAKEAVRIKNKEQDRLKEKVIKGLSSELKSK